MFFVLHKPKLVELKSFFVKSVVPEAVSRVFPSCYTRVLEHVNTIEIKPDEELEGKDPPDEESLL